MSFSPVQNLDQYKDLVDKKIKQIVEETKINIEENQMLAKEAYKLEAELQTVSKRAKKLKNIKTMLIIFATIGITLILFFDNLDL